MRAVSNRRNVPPAEINRLRIEVFKALGFENTLNWDILPTTFGEKGVRDKIFDAVAAWSADSRNINRLTTLMQDRGLAPIRTVTFGPNTNPAMVALAVLNLQAHANVAERENWRYIIDIQGVVDGETRHFARTVSRNDPQFISALVAGMVSGRVGQWTLELDENDYDEFILVGDMEIDQVRVIRIAKGISMPDAEEFEYEVMAPPSAPPHRAPTVGSVGGSTGSRADTQIAVAEGQRRAEWRRYFERTGRVNMAIPRTIQAPRMSERLSRFYAPAPGTRHASFFGFWLDPRWPEDMSHIQVFKKDQMYDMNGKIQIDKVMFELGCLANSFLIQGMPLDKLVTVMEIISGTANPNFPTACLKNLSERLSINIRCTFYDSTHRSKKRRYIVHRGGRMEDEEYCLARIEDHYVADTDSGWGRRAATRFLHFYEELGQEYKNVSLDRIKMAARITQHAPNLPKRLMVDMDQKKCTYGELLCILVYGVDPVFSAEGVIRIKPVPGQASLVTSMVAEDYCLKHELYSRFKDQFATRNLPTHMTEEEMTKWIVDSSKPMTKQRQSLLCMKHFEVGKDLGPSYSFVQGNGKKTQGRRGHRLVDQAFRSTLRGSWITPEWTFYDRYTFKSGYSGYSQSEGGEAGTVFFDVPQSYTVMAMDSETYCSKEIDRTTGNEMLVHRPYMFCIAFFEGENGEPLDFRDVDDAIWVLEEGKKRRHEGSYYERVRLNCPWAELVVETFRGHNCAQDLCNFLAGTQFEGHHLHIVSHNAHYDINMLVGNSDAVILSGIIKSASKLNTAILKSGGKIHHHQCSYAVTGIPLKEFATTFDLDVGKEYMPYDLYTSENLFDEDGMPDLQAAMLSEEVWGFSGAPSLAEFERSIANSGKIKRWWMKDDVTLHTFNLWSYAQYYCETDCKVLMKGFLNLRDELYNLPIPDYFTPENLWKPCALDIIHAASLPQFANHYMGRCGVFDGIYQFRGSIREYLSRSVVGGKCMIRGNAPHHVGEKGKTRLKDFDACSLYPSGMDRLASEGLGFTMGLPKFWMAPQKEDCIGVFDLPDELRTAHAYFVSIRIWQLGRPLVFPVVSLMDGKEGRHFTNCVEGDAMVVDRVTLEDIYRFHHSAVIEYRQALYFTTGANTRIGSVIQYLYRSRLQLKAEGKGAAQTARKLAMNAMYGRMIMKPIGKKLFFIQEEWKIYHYIARHSTSMATANFIRDDFAVVERRTPVFEHYSMPHLGAPILSMAKRIMNEVTTLAQDIGCIIHYMDTDSMHISEDDIGTLSKAFLAKYGRKLVVTPGRETEFTAAEEALGLFHSDFKSYGEKWTEPVSKELIIIGKKAYYDSLMVHQKEMPEDERTEENAHHYDHIRLKGIPNACIVRHALLNDITVRDIFSRLLDGETFEFDLVQGSVRFEMTKEFQTRTRLSFMRTVKLDAAKLDRAKTEWLANGWGASTFPHNHYRGGEVGPISPAMTDDFHEEETDPDGMQCWQEGDVDFTLPGPLIETGRAEEVESPPSPLVPPPVGSPKYKNPFLFVGLDNVPNYDIHPDLDRDYELHPLHPIVDFTKVFEDDDEDMSFLYDVPTPPPDE